MKKIVLLSCLVVGTEQMSAAGHQGGLRAEAQLQRPKDHGQLRSEPQLRTGNRHEEGSSLRASATLNLGKRKDVFEQIKEDRATYNEQRARSTHVLHRKLVPKEYQVKEEVVVGKINSPFLNQENKQNRNVFRRPVAVRSNSNESGYEGSRSSSPVRSRSTSPVRRQSEETALLLPLDDTGTYYVDEHGKPTGRVDGKPMEHALLIPDDEEEIQRPVSRSDSNDSSYGSRSSSPKPNEYAFLVPDDEVVVVPANVAKKEEVAYLVPMED